VVALPVCPLWCKLVSADNCVESMDPHPHDDSNLSPLAALLAMAFGAVAFWNGWMLLTDQGSKDWPTTTGTISEVRTVPNYLDMVTRGAGNQLVVRYIYEVNGTHYTGETEFHGYKSQQAAEAAKKGYTYGGGGMMVHYNPSFNWASTLSPGSGVSSYLIGLCVFGLLSLCVGLSRVFVSDSTTSPLPD
jgi:hypothetical protein